MILCDLGKCDVQFFSRKIKPNFFSIYTLSHGHSSGSFTGRYGIGAELNVK